MSEEDTQMPTFTLARGREGRLIAAMLSCKTLEEAAKVAKVNRRTLFNARKNPAFMAAYQSAADGMLETTINQLRSNALAATATLAQIASDTTQPGNSRVRAAEVTLTTLLKSVEYQDLLRRVAKLEEAGEGEQPCLR